MQLTLESPCHATHARESVPCNSRSRVRAMDKHTLRHEDKGPVSMNTREPLIMFEPRSDMHPLITSHAC